MFLLLVLAPLEEYLRACVSMYSPVFSPMLSHEPLRHLPTSLTYLTCQYPSSLRRMPNQPIGSQSPVLIFVIALVPCQLRATKSPSSQPAPTSTSLGPLPRPPAHSVFVLSFLCSIPSVSLLPSTLHSPLENPHPSFIFPQKLAIKNQSRLHHLARPPASTHCHTALLLQLRPN